MKKAFIKDEWFNKIVFSHNESEAFRMLKEIINFQFGNITTLNLDNKSVKKDVIDFVNYTKKKRIKNMERMRKARKESVPKAKKEKPVVVVEKVPEDKKNESEELFPVSPAEKEEKKRIVFKKPTVFEVEDFCKNVRKNEVDAEEFWNYYESVGWKIGGKPMKNWQCAVITWERNRKKYYGDRNKKIVVNSNPEDYKKFSSDTF